MNSVTKDFLVSPSVKMLTSPKCLTTSFSKEIKGNYTNYFKSTKSGIFSSPNAKEEGNHKIHRSHSGTKWSKEKDSVLGINGQEIHEELNM